MFASLISSGIKDGGPIEDGNRCATGMFPKSGVCLAGALGIDPLD